MINMGYVLNNNAIKLINNTENNIDGFLRPFGIYNGKPSSDYIVYCNLLKFNLFCNKGHVSSVYAKVKELNEKIMKLERAELIRLIWENAELRKFIMKRELQISKHLRLIYLNNGRVAVFYSESEIGGNTLFAASSIADEGVLDNKGVYSLVLPIFSDEDTFKIVESFNHSEISNLNIKYHEKSLSNFSNLYQVRLQSI
ncbi:hypothetical protein D3C81_11590 [compost metagenome]